MNLIKRNPKGSVYGNTYMRRMCSRIRYSYLDRIDFDTNERIFYLYYMGRYGNVPHYHYGETSDLYTKELELLKTIPFYKRIMYVPTNNTVIGNGKERLDLFVTSKRIGSHLPLSSKLGRIETFVPTDECNLSIILSEIDAIFKALEV